MTDRTFWLHFPSSRGRSFAIDEARQPFPDIARLVEMPGPALRAPADGKRHAVEIGHDGEHALVGDVVADENRAPALERFVAHQFGDPRCLVEAGMLDL